MAKKRITTIYPRDKNALSALARCGYVSREQLGEFLREKRVQSYCKDGLIEKSIYSRPGARAQDVEVYRLTKAGRELCRHPPLTSFRRERRTGCVSIWTRTG